MRGVFVIVLLLLRQKTGLRELVLKALNRRKSEGRSGMFLPNLSRSGEGRSVMERESPQGASPSRLWQVPAFSLCNVGRDSRSSPIPEASTTTPLHHAPPASPHLTPPALSSLPTRLRSPLPAEKRQRLRGPPWTARQHLR